VVNSIVFAAEEATVADMEEVWDAETIFNLNQKNMISRRRHNRARLITSSTCRDGRWARRTVGRSATPDPMLPEHRQLVAVQKKIDAKTIIISSP
jgi:hypothetical protein